MNNFNYFQPTDIRFGCGRLSELGDTVLEIGKKCILVTVPVFDAIEPSVNKVKSILSDAGVSYKHFDKVMPNPTTDIISEGAKLAKEFKADTVIGFGGGSSMDTAKAIAVEATHKGTAWDYLFFKEMQPTCKTLPIITVSTTSGTGSHVTQVAVVSNLEEKRKSALYNSFLFPKISIIDPELMLTIPEHVSACTGFDVFTHAFEAYIHKNTSPYVEMLTLEAIKLVIKNLPKIINDSQDLVARTQMAWADTLAGLSIANAGVTLPHGIGMAIGGCCSHVMHGEALAAIYPEFVLYTYSSAIAKFADLSRMLDENLMKVEDSIAAEKTYALIKEFLKKIKMNISLKEIKVDKIDLDEIAEVSLELPDYTNNPRVADINEIKKILNSSYDF
jgi:alcohol dehydrogenase class IV